MRHGLFTIGALDNLDHNPSSTTSKGSFHGTGISLFQFPTSAKFGNVQSDITLHLPGVTKNHQLPDYYVNVPAVALQTTKVSVPQQLTVSVSQENQLENAQSKENNWLAHASKLLEKHEVESGDTISWSAFHASLQNRPENLSSCLTQLLPLFYEKASTAAMIKHGITVLQHATEFLNPGQIPVMAFDAPLLPWPNLFNGNGLKLMERVSL